jgi:hypothetical protein
MGNPWTEGPWSVFAEGVNYGIEAGEQSIVVYGSDDDETHGVLGESREKMQANARLISSAPELFDALSAVDRDWTEAFPEGPDGNLEWCGGLGCMSDKTAEIWRGIRAALAKARGETP